jgi:hypothetical protein
MGLGLIDHTSKPAPEKNISYRIQDVDCILSDNASPEKCI